MKTDNREQEPRLAFRYLASHWEETLRDSEFKIAKPSDFNDPFDCVGACQGSVGNQVARKHAKGLLENHIAQLPQKPPRRERRDLEQKAYRFCKKEYSEVARRTLERRDSLDDTTRVLCFSETELNDEATMLMWAHYAWGHKGVRLGVDLSQLNGVVGKLDRVTYTNNRPKYDFTDKEALGFDGGPGCNFFVDMVFTKGLVWEYEREVRFLTNPEVCKTRSFGEQEFDFLEFAPDFIRRVDFGLLMATPDQERCLSILKEPQYGHVTVWKSIYNPTKYAIDYERVQ